MPRLKLVIEYDGTDFVGWQTQANGVSVQATIESALGQLTRQPVSVLAAGRTDSGVHARGQVIAFDDVTTLPLRAYVAGLNRLLPQSIGVVSAEVVADDFDPRRWSLGKRYCYRISNHSHRAPLLRRTHWQIFQPLDLAGMRQSAECLIGRHDFSAFRAADCQARHAVREVKALTVSGEPKGKVEIGIEGTAFLKHMVRNIVGTLVQVGKGKAPPEWVEQVLKSKTRALAGMTAPAHGLTLETVFLGEGPRAAASQGEV
jgi:tRNA pseudouridine38-40 synthase